MDVMTADFSRYYHVCAIADAVGLGALADDVRQSLHVVYDGPDSYARCDKAAWAALAAALKGLGGQGWECVGLDWPQRANRYIERVAPDASFRFDIPS